MEVIWNQEEEQQSAGADCQTSQIDLLSNPSLKSLLLLCYEIERRSSLCVLLASARPLFFSSSYSPKFSAVLSVEDFVVDCVGVSLVACLPALSLSLSPPFLICSLLIPDRVVVE